MKKFNQSLGSKFTFLILAISIFTISCTKSKVEPTGPVSNVGKAVVVLNDNSGFDSVFNIIADVSGVGALGGDIGLCDFTLESNSNLNYNYFLTIPYQQGNNTNYFRKTFNINSKQDVALPTKAKTNVLQGFYKPYSNVYTYPSVITNSSAGNTTYKVNFDGDILADIPKRDYSAEPDMGFLFPMLNPITVPGGIKKGFFTYGFKPDNSDPYSFNNFKVKEFTDLFPTSASSPKVLASLFDVSIINKGKPTSKTEDYSYSFDLRSDSFFVHSVFDTTFNGFDPSLGFFKKIVAIPVSSGLTNSGCTKIRHYSVDGKIMSMFFQDITTKKCWSFSFDYATHTLTKGLENALLDYSAEGSDIDIDEYGNVYYSGKAGNGTNANGVSIYRKSISGMVTLVGTDNILKYGTIIKLKYLFGKVYFALTGTISGTNIKQLTIIKQK